MDDAASRFMPARLRGHLAGALPAHLADLGSNDHSPLEYVESGSIVARTALLTAPIEDIGRQVSAASAAPGHRISAGR